MNGSLDRLMVNEDPNEGRIACALSGAVGVTRDSYSVRPLARFRDLSLRDKILAYLLGAVAAALLRDGHLADVDRIAHRELDRRLGGKLDFYVIEDDDWIEGSEDSGYRLNLALVEDTAEWLIERRSEDEITKEGEQ